ncbi:hypothetical protein DFQ27_007678 [Actinomortierella ambigua]|uniref:Uncharacterized protein n=1 Tax=Actinomortierella ambigua TaxID=1343610 RepID=A0A9P6QKS1_9FUNG|nr:hypothetical protein DFQ27_007678 [Actinomortierella ambigua]
MCAAAYAQLNQRVEWDNRIIADFDQYADEHQGLSDVSEDYIMDLTADSSFISSLPRDIFDLVLLDLPSLPSAFPELAELNQLIDGRSSFQDLQDLVYNITPNTNVRRFLYGSVKGYSKYFPHHTPLSDKDERQLMIDIIDPVLQGAFEVFGMSRDLPDANTGVDFIVRDSNACQLVLAGCSAMYETDMRKFVADRWRLSRAMKDTFDTTMTTYAESVLPHSRYSVFGIQIFDRKVTFLQMDFRKRYRLWQLAWVHIPTSLTEFERNFSRYITKSLCFAKLVGDEVRCRNNQDPLPFERVIALQRAARRLAPTTPPPPISPTPSSPHQ